MLEVSEFSVGRILIEELEDGDRLNEGAGEKGVRGRRW